MQPNVTLCNLVRYAVVQCNLSYTYTVTKLLLYIGVMSHPIAIITFSLLFLLKDYTFFLGDYLGKGYTDLAQIRLCFMENRINKVTLSYIRLHKGYIKTERLHPLISSA